MSHRVRASELPKIVSTECKLRSCTQRLIQTYVFALMISGYPKSLQAIALHFAVSISSLSRLLSHALLAEELQLMLNRQVRKRIAAYINSNRHARVEIIIDATLLERSSHKAENVGLYHSNKKKIWGHRITNVGLLLDGEFYVPIAFIPHYTRSFARASGLSYLTEGMMVRRWLRKNMSGLIETLGRVSIRPEDVTFLLDAGYDNAKIQKSIRNLGCHFLMMLKNTRAIEGMQIKKFFKANRRIAWSSVHFNKTVNGKKRRRKYRIRTANNVMLAGVGKVNAVCSEKTDGRRNKKTRRYLATSRLELPGREILHRYFGRWSIETWHKDIKQNYGFNDCSASTFKSIENHLHLCLIAYHMHLEGYKSMPSKGTTLTEFLQYAIRRDTRNILTRITGRSRLMHEIAARHEEIFAEAS